MPLWRGTLETMRRYTALATALCLACALAFLGASSEAATAKKKSKRPAPPPSRVNPALRAASLRKVADYLSDPPEQTFAQPGALVPAFEQLFRLSSKSPSAPPVHIIHFGDSHTAADDFTGGIRDLLKARFGDGGSGFSLAGHPFLGYRRFDVHGGGTPGWQSEGLRSASGDGFFGLGGVSISTSHPGQSVYLDTECDHLEIDYLQQPGGGDLALYDYDERLEQFSTAGELGAGFLQYQATPGPHRYGLRTLTSRPVRLFGWVADRQAGVTYEALGINGAEAGVILRWDQDMLATYLQRRNPGLIVLAYGTNEASDPNWSQEPYQSMFSALLQRLRRAAPAASILVLGPPDRWYRNRSAFRPYPGIDWVIAAQQSACRENACTFWDTRARMGGKGSMRDWVTAGLAQGDHVHFTSAGYRRLAGVLFADIMGQYDTYKKTRQESAGQD
jgi:lysophospholipase L1-like esterase